jgi:hypothetical protein
LSLADCAVAEADVDDLCELGEFDVVEDDQRTIDFDNGAVVDTGGDGVVPRDCLQIGVEELSLIHGNYNIYEIKSYLVVINI